MNSFYSIIYAGINPVAGEKLAVGLFMRGGDQLLFAWSKLRTSLVRELMGGDAQRLLVQNLKSLQRKCAEHSSEVSGFFPDHELEKKSSYELNEPYFQYLATYSGNLLNFGSVTSIELEVNQQRFEELFRLFVDDREAPVVHSELKDIDLTKTQLKERIGSHVSWNVNVSQDEIPGLLLPSVRLDFIGRNDKDVIGEVVDFEKPEYYLEAELNKLGNVSNALDQAKRLGKAFVIGDEPVKAEYPQQHKAWAAMRAYKKIELVPTNELDRVHQHLVQMGIRPWRNN